MSRSVVITASAFLLSAGVLAFTILYSPEVKDPAPKERPLADPTRKFNPLEKDKTEKSDRPIAPSGVVEKYYVRKFDEQRKQLTILSGERAMPRPNGVIDIEGITAHIHLVPGKRVVEIKGPLGTLVAPENNPESGTLTGGVVLTLFESAGDEPVRLERDSPHVQLRMYLDEAVKFDLIIGTVQSDGPVHLTMPRADFKGRGMDLVYNEKRRRINRLEILHGEEMRFNPNAIAAAEAPKEPATQPPSVAPAKPKTPVETREPDYYKATFEKNVLVRSAEALMKAQKLEVLFTMENREAKQAEKPVTPAARTSDARSAGSALATAAKALAPPASPSAADLPGSPARSLMPVREDDVTVNWTGTLLVEPFDEKPDDLAGPDDTMLVLTGKVDVLTDREETIRAHRVEYLSSEGRVHILGDAATPAVIESPESGTLHVLDLLLYQKRGIGSITGPGSIVSSGDRPPAVEAVAADGKPVAGGRAAPAGPLPIGVSVEWTEGAELTFHIKAPAPKVKPATGAADAKQSNDASAKTAAAPVEKKSISPSAKLDALKDAVFTGHVKVEHPQFDLQSHRLHLAMAPPAGQKQEPQRVTATGDVHATARGSEKQPPMEIEAKELEITFANDSRGKPQPARMLATQSVKATQPGRVLTAGRLDVALAEEAVKTDEKKSEKPGAAPVAPPAAPPKVVDAAKAAPAAPAKKDDSPRMEVRSVVAEEDVRITMDEPRTLVTGARVEAEAAAGLLQIFGTDAKPARVERVDDALTGKHITLRESDQFVTVPGAGTAEFVTRSSPRVETKPAAANDPAKPAAAPVAAAPKAPGDPQHLKITWSTAMDFNNTTGVGHFHGNVNATSERGVDLSRFQAGELTLELDPVDPKDKREGGFLGAAPKPAAPVAAPAAPVAAPSAAVKSPAAKPEDKAPARNVRKMLAQHKVVFEAEKWDDKVGGKLATRFRLTGPILTFDNTTEKLDVFGPGTMQLEDYRAKEKAKKDAENKAAPGSAAPAAPAPPAPDKAAAPVAFVGNGVTLFLWEGAMSIDANHNDVRMEKQVRMLQQPASGADIHMQCDQLIADFQSTGGLSSWLTGKAAEPKLDNVTASGRLVILYQKQTVRGDQLYYTGAKQMAIISAEQGRMCELETEQTVLPARQFRWMLERDRIIAEEPGAVRTKPR